MSKELANLMSKVEKYRGKHVVAVGDEIVVVKDEKELKEALKRLEKKYPGRTEETLSIWISAWIIGGLLLRFIGSMIHFNRWEWCLSSFIIGGLLAGLAVWCRRIKESSDKRTLMMK